MLNAARPCAQIRRHFRVNAMKNKFYKKIIRLVLVCVCSIFCIVSLCACNAAEQYFVFNIDLTLSAEGVGSSDLIEEIYKYADSLESVISPAVSGSDLYKINCSAAGNSVRCADVTMEIMKIAERAFDLSDGAYDPSVYPLVLLWKFSGDTFGPIGNKQAAPSDDEIKTALKYVGLDKAFTIDYQNNTITKNVGYDSAMLDFGGVAKGYIVQKALETAGENQKLLVNFGGNIGGVNKNYSIGIRNPRLADTGYYGKFELQSGYSVSTSGDYERYYSSVTSDGSKGDINDKGVKTYCHIINPFTGYPCDFGEDTSETLVSATVICSDGGLGDALSTAVMVLGKTAGGKLIEKAGVYGVIIDGALNCSVFNGLEFFRKK